MGIKLQVASAVGGVALALAVGTSTALAHFCTNVSKETGAGSIGTYNVMTESFTPNKRVVAKPDGGEVANGGFITITDGATFSYDVFMHQMLPEGALAAGPGGDDQCDGQAVEFALDCLGIEAPE